MVFNKRSDLRDPEILKYIFKAKNEGGSYVGITKAVYEKFKVSISSPTAKSLYLNYCAKAKAVSQSLKHETNKGLENQTNYDQEMNKRFERITQIVNKLMDSIETVGKDLPPEIFLKQAPTILAVCREVLNQLAFIRREQEQIVLKQKNLIYSPLQIMQQVNQIIKEKEKSGMIIYKDKKSGLIITPEEKKKEKEIEN